MNYKEYLCSAEWWARRNKAMERARGMCENCLYQKATCVHHLTYERVFNELPDDLIALCDPCHEGVHSGRANVSRKQRPAVVRVSISPIARELWELSNLMPDMRCEILKSVYEWESVLDYEVYKEACNLLTGCESSDVFKWLAEQQKAKQQFVRDSPLQRWQRLKARMTERRLEIEKRRQLDAIGELSEQQEDEIVNRFIAENRKANGMPT